MSSIDQIILYSLLFFIACIYDYSRGANQANAKFLFSVIFIFVEGTRYGRGVDQVFVYGPEYLNCLNPGGIARTIEPLYLLLITTIRHVDPLLTILPFGSIFFVYAAIFVLCFLKIYDDYKECTSNFVIFGVLATLWMTEGPIRQGIGFCFMLPAIYYLNHCDLSCWRKSKKPFLGAIVFLIMPIFFHKGNFLAVCLIPFVWIFLNRKPISWKITIPIFLLLELTPLVGYIDDMIHTFSATIELNEENNYYQRYLTQEQHEWELEESINGTRGFLTQTLAVLFYTSIIWIGYKVHEIIDRERKKSFVFIYNIFVISILVAEPFRLFGSFARLFLPTSVLWFVPMAYSAYYYSELCEIKYFKTAFFIFVAYLLLYYGRFVFMNPAGMFVWSYRF